MKKRISVILLSFLLVSLFSMTLFAQEEANLRHVWTNQSVASDTEGVFRIVTWETSYEVKVFADEINKFFETYYPNIQVNFDWGNEWNNYWTKIPTMLASGNQPDLIWMHDSKVKSFADKNLLTNLDEYIEELPPMGWTYDWYPSQVNAFKYHDSQYAIPMDLAPMGVYINKDLFDEAGIDYPTDGWTYDDMVEIAKKLTKDTTGNGRNDQMGVSMALNQPYTPYEVIRAFGGRYFDMKNNKALIDDPKTVEAIKFMGDLIHKHEVMSPSTEEADTSRAFVQGKLGMIFLLNDMAYGLNDTIGDRFEWGLIPVPTGPVAKAQYVGGSAMAVPSGAKNKQIAYELIRYLLSNPNTLPEISATRSTYVARKSFSSFAVDSDMYEILPNYHDIFSTSAAEYGVVPPMHSKFNEFSSLWNRFLDPVFITGEEDAETAASKLQVEAQKLMDELE